MGNVPPDKIRTIDVEELCRLYDVVIHEAALRGVVGIPSMLAVELLREMYRDLHHVDVVPSIAPSIPHARDVRANHMPLHDVDLAPVSFTSLH
jgi:hypothetical protein